MNEEQRRKAEEIVKNSKIEEIEKKYALYLHLDTVEEVSKYNLPYKVLKEHHKNEIGKGYARICSLYPLPGYPKDERPMFNYPNDYNEDNPTYGGGTSDKLKAEHKQILDDFIAKYEKDFNDTQVWDYYLIHLLKGYDFNTFTVFDFYGENKEVPQADLSLLRKYYTRKQKEFESNPGNYLSEEPTYTEKERREYSHGTHLVRYSDEVIQKHFDSMNDKARKHTHSVDEIEKVLLNGDMPLVEIPYSDINTEKE